MTKKRKRLLFWTVVPMSAIVFAVFAPHFLFQQTRVSAELKQTVLDGVRLEAPLENVIIVDYKGRWFSMYAKLDLSLDEYNQLKQIFLQAQIIATNKNFTGEIPTEMSRYHYNPDLFASMLAVMKNVKHRYSAKSMNLDDYEELLITDRLYRKVYFFIAGTTGENHYVLAKEKNGNCYLYICA